MYKKRFNSRLVRPTADNNRLDRKEAKSSISLLPLTAEAFYKFCKMSQKSEDRIVKPARCRIGTDW